MQLLDTEKAQAVFFFGSEGIAKELLYTEFQALLDGYVPISEWTNQTRKAAYLEFNADFIAVAAVFFTMSFNAKGGVDASWNLPLADMARTVSKGPDLGAGPIHLVCSSLCPVAYFKDWLWDPSMKSSSGHFGQIKKALKRNRLGVHFTEVDTGSGSGLSKKEVQKLELRLSQQFSKQYDSDLRDQMAQLLKDQRLLGATMNSEKEEAIKELRLTFAQKMESQQQILEEKEAAFKDAEQRNGELKDTIDGQVQKIEGLRDYYEHKLRRAKNGDQESIESVIERHKIELDAKVAIATSDVNDLLKMKEVELTYRIEHEEQLKSEISRLRQDGKDLLDNSGDQLLEKLSRKGVNFVTYQPGAGHITIPLSEISRFVENPNAFTADYCGVSEKHYLAWLKHYQAPVCGEFDRNGDMCCENVSRIVSPAEFVLGDSDCCEQHSRLKKTINRAV